MRSAIVGLLCSGALLPAGLQACSSETSEPTSMGASGAGGTQSPTGGSGGTSVVVPDTPGGAGGGGSPGSLCGELTCSPDKGACTVGVVPQSQELGGGAGVAGLGGNAGSSAGTPNGGLGMGGASGSGGLPSLPTDSCQIVRVESGMRSECHPAGRGELDAPCFGGGDCRAGLGCVGGDDIGRCRPFCCAGEISCDPFPGTYCASRPLRANEEDTELEPLEVPVCVAAEDCALEQTYPCPEGRQCDCAEPTVCAVVRGDGTTACVEPGDGEAGDPCPCAWGHVCSQGTGRCLELCSTIAGVRECSDGLCQASAELPDDWGACIGM